jgi:hypothetical protein
MRHLEVEKAAGKQIFPAFAGLETMNEEGKGIDKSRLWSLRLRGQRANFFSLQAA